MLVLKTWSMFWVLFSVAYISGKAHKIPRFIQQMNFGCEVDLERWSVASAVREDREPAVTGQDGRATVQIAEAVTGSVESGRAARLVGEVYEFL